MALCEHSGANGLPDNFSHLRLTIEPEHVVHEMSTGFAEPWPAGGMDRSDRTDIAAVNDGLHLLPVPIVLLLVRYDELHAAVPATPVKGACFRQFVGHRLFHRDGAHAVPCAAE